MKKELFINIALSCLSAVLLILSTAGFGLSYLVFVAFLPLLWAVKRGGLHPFISGWITGFLYFVVCLSWMTVTFGYFGGAPLAASLGLLLFISLFGGALFFAPFTYIARKYSNPLLLAMVFIALEAVKGSLFFGGVPWLNLAQSQYKNTLILQFVSWFGELGLSFIIMLINILIFKLLTEQNKKLGLTAVSVAIVIMLIPGIVNKISPKTYHTTKTVKIIQPGYKQEDKWQREKIMSIIQDMNKRLITTDKTHIDLIVMPESAYPARILEVPFIMDIVKNIAEKTPIVAGTDRRITDGSGQITDLFNSMVLIDEKPQVQIYDKRHLTPFGEYFPFENLLAPIKEFFFGQGRMFSFGTAAAILETGNMKIAPLICFESGFSELVKEPVAMGANMLVIISNDSWFGKNQGRIQHMAVNVMRAVEYGKATAVATQDGISGFILPDGSIPLMITEQKPAELTYSLPLSDDRTIYSYIRYIWIAFVMAIVYYFMRKNRNNAE